MVEPATDSVAVADAGRLVLGTAGLGLAYGLPQADGSAPLVVSDARAQALITAAWDLGIRTFDTAPAYGCAEARVGAAVAERGQVWAKLAAGMAPSQSLTESLVRLRRTKVELVQWHNWQPGTVAEAEIVAISGDPRVKAIGCSTYGRRDADAAITSQRFAVVQVEWNLLNQAVLCGRRALPTAVKIAVRSVWLQGVLHDRPLPTHLAGLAPAHERASAFAAGLGLSLPVLALRAALDQPLVRFVVIGADHPDQLAVVATALKTPPLSSTVLARLSELHLDSPLTDPRTWSNP